MSEQPHPVCVHERVEGRVGVGEHDGRQCERHGHITLWAEQQDAVDYVDGHPAHHEEKQDQEEGGGFTQLLKVGSGLGGLSRMRSSGGRATDGSGCGDSGSRLCEDNSRLGVNKRANARLFSRPHVCSDSSRSSSA